MYEPESVYRDEPQVASRHAEAMGELSGALDQAEKYWDRVAQRLAPFVGEGVPREENVLKAAPPVATSAAVRGIYELAQRVREFAGRMDRVGERLEL